MRAKSQNEKTRCTTLREVMHLSRAVCSTPDGQASHLGQRSEYRRGHVVAAHSSHLRSGQLQPCRRARHLMHEPHPSRFHTRHLAALLQYETMGVHQGWCYACRDANDACGYQCESQYRVWTAVRDRLHGRHRCAESVMQAHLPPQAQRSTTLHCA